MGSIKASISEINSFRSSCSNSYGAIISRAESLLSNTLSYLSECERELSNIASQISSLNSLKSDIAQKIINFKGLMDEAQAEIDRCNVEIEYILSHPKKVTEVDSEGNEYTVEVIDEAALADATNRRDIAEAEFKKYRARFEESQAIERDISEAINKFTTIERGMKLLKDSISNNVYEIKKYLNAMLSESEHNIKSLDAILEALIAYVNSKKMSIPSGSTFGSFGAGSANPNVTNGATITINFGGKKMTYEEMMKEHEDMLKNAKAEVGVADKRISDYYLNKGRNLKDIVMDKIYDISRYGVPLKTILKETEKIEDKSDKKLREKLKDFVEDKVMKKLQPIAKEIIANENNLGSYVRGKVVAKAIVSSTEFLVTIISGDSSKLTYFQEKYIDQMTKDSKDVLEKSISSYYTHYFEPKLSNKLGSWKEKREFSKINKKTK